MTASKWDPKDIITLAFVAVGSAFIFFLSPFALVWMEVGTDVSELSFVNLACRFMALPLANVLLLDIIEDVAGDAHPYLKGIIPPALFPARNVILIGIPWAVTAVAHFTVPAAPEFWMCLGMALIIPIANAVFFGTLFHLRRRGSRYWTEKPAEEGSRMSVSRKAAMIYVAAMGIIPLAAMSGAYYLGIADTGLGPAILYILALGLVQFLSWAWMLVKISDRWTPGRAAVPCKSGDKEDRNRCR